MPGETSIIHHRSERTRLPSPLSFVPPQNVGGCGGGGGRGPASAATCPSIFLRPLHLYLLPVAPFRSALSLAYSHHRIYCKTCEVAFPHIYWLPSASSVTQADRSKETEDEGSNFSPPSVAAAGGDMEREEGRERAPGFMEPLPCLRFDSDRRGKKTVLPDISVSRPTWHFRTLPFAHSSSFPSLYPQKSSDNPRPPWIRRRRRPRSALPLLWHY